MKLETHQKIIDHLTKQKARSVIAGTGNCRYRSPNGTMCAVGCLIPDEIYESAMEMKSVGHLQRRFAESLHFLAADTEELSKWQQYHDSHYAWYAMVARMSFSYQKWLDGEEGQSPQKFFESAFKESGKGNFVCVS